MNDKKIYLSVGDDYEVKGIDEDNPCREYLGGTGGNVIIPLKEAIKNFKGDFEYWTGSHWGGPACLAYEEREDFHVEIRAKTINLDKQQIRDFVYSKLNTPEVKSELEKMGVKGFDTFRVWWYGMSSCYEY